MTTAKRYFSRWTNWIGLLIVLGFVGVAVFAPLITPLVKSTDPGNPGLTRRKIDQIPGNRSITVPPQPPADYAPLGTTDQKEDILYLLVWGTQEVVVFSIKVSLLTASIGIFIGAISSYLGGWIGGLLMRITDGFIAIPVIAGFFILDQLRTLAASNYPNAVDYMYGVGTPPPALAQILAFDAQMWAIILFTWMPYTRLMHAMITRMKNSDFIQATRALGAGPGRLIIRHLLPNTISPAIVLLARDFGAVVLLQAGMAFAGFGGSTLWVSLLLSQRKWILTAGGNPFGYWWIWVPVTVALVLYGVGWNILGDGLNDALNPRSRNQ